MTIVRTETRKRPRAKSSLFARGEPMVWITGGALVLCLAMIIGLLALVFVRGAATFWPVPVLRIETGDGRVLMGEQNKEEEYTPTGDPSGGVARRRSLRTGNFELTRRHFHWVSDLDVETETRPEWATVLERLNWGRFYGFPKRFEVDGEPTAEGAEKTWAAYEEIHSELRDRAHERKRLMKGPLGRIDGRRLGPSARCHHPQSCPGTVWKRRSHWTGRARF